MFTPGSPVGVKGHWQIDRCSAQTEGSNPGARRISQGEKCQLHWGLNHRPAGVKANALTTWPPVLLGSRSSRYNGEEIARCKKAFNIKPVKFGQTGLFGQPALFLLYARRVVLCYGAWCLSVSNILWTQLLLQFPSSLCFKKINMQIYDNIL